MPSFVGGFEMLLCVLLAASMVNDVEGLTVMKNCEKKYTDLSPQHTMCLEESPDSSEVVLSQADKDFIVKKHNELRASVQPSAADMQKMVWDDKLAEVAGKWARQCIKDHDDNDARRIPEYPGTFITQNAAFGHKNFKKAIEKWYAEKDDFTYGEPYKVGTGHFYQIVFHGASRIGCGQARCPHDIHKNFRVCNYAAGLDVTFPPYTNGTPCALCPDHCDAEFQSLCDCHGKICYHDGTVDVSTCNCICEQGFKGDLCETRDCPNEDYSRRCQFASKEDCGVRVNPENCPILCGLCPKPCNGKECQNEGKLNYDTCACDCKGNFTGDLCELCPANDAEDCPTKHTSYCESSAIIRADCPYRCGLCDESDSPCDGLVCHHHGRLDPDTCTCNCVGSFTGHTCEICPEEDESYCETQSKSMCTDYPHGAFWMEKNCPHKCSHCT